jgi:hypothetical protein
MAQLRQMSLRLEASVATSKPPNFPSATSTWLANNGPGVQPRIDEAHHTLASLFDGHFTLENNAASVRNGRARSA